jgi:lipopolysaccharide transport system ATP-binding protein
MNSIIRIENISKQYRIGVRKEAYTTLRDSVSEALRSPARLWQNWNGGQKAETIWALRDISFSVQPGEVIGIIGRNGAGKSTLLKVLSRITEPTSGRIDLYGRVASLLEVGTGFHPELTGRENIYLNGAILGMRKAEIVAKFDEIVAFAELEKYIETPVKRYSSGMYMRLAFAVASHLEPEILVVDEVLAVGDAQFQKKCLGRMNDVASEGRTVLFVSHNMAAVQSLCRRVVWLNEGRIIEDGPTRSAVSHYLKTSSTTEYGQVWEDIAKAPGNEIVRLRSAFIRPRGQDSSDLLTVRTPFDLEFEYWNLQPETRLNLSLVLINGEGVVVFNTGPVNERFWHGNPFPKGLFRSVCRVPGNLLNDDTYRIQLLMVKDESAVIFHLDDVLVFEIHETGERRGAWFGKWIGTVRPSLEWTTELIAADPLMAEKK